MHSISIVRKGLDQLIIFVILKNESDVLTCTYSCQLSNIFYFINWFLTKHKNSEFSEYLWLLLNNTKLSYHIKTKYFLKPINKKKTGGVWSHFNLRIWNLLSVPFIYGFNVTENNTILASSQIFRHWKFMILLFFWFPHKLNVLTALFQFGNVSTFRF